MTTQITAPAGWYADHTGQQRWWDGAAWGEYAPAATVAAGWYPDNTGHLRWWDGSTWGPYAPPQQQPAQQPAQQVQYVEYAGRTANQMPVAYNRQQAGHSIVLHLLFGWLLFYIPTLYYAVSPNHYFHF